MLMLRCSLIIIISPLEVTNSGYPTDFQSRLRQSESRDLDKQNMEKERGGKV